MAVFRLSVMLVVLMLVMTGNCSPLQPGLWDHWRYLQQLKVRQQKAHQEVTEPSRSRLWSAHQRQQKLEEEQEQDQERQAAVQSMLEDYNLEEVAVELGMDALSTLIMPHPHGPDTPTCITKRTPITMADLMPPLTGEVVYTVCGAGDAASLHLRFQELSETTPSVDTTTASATTTPSFDLCPNHHTTTPIQETTTTPPGNTTTPVDAQKAVAEPVETTTPQPKTTTVVA